VHLPLFIAKRYLFAKKSHNVINIISLISAGGIALGTMSLIIILSVYNGFEGLIKSLYSNNESDLLILPAEGKSFNPRTADFGKIRGNPGTARFCEIVEENVFVKYGNKEAVATIKGVDSTYVSGANIDDYIIEGKFSLFDGELPQAIVGKNIALNLGLRTHFVDPLYLYFPSRYGSISLLNPASSLNLIKVFPAGIFAIEQNFDKKFIFVPISYARELLELDKEATSVEIYVKEGSDIGRLKKEFSKDLGKQFVIKDRYEQNETLYKMMKSEKLSIYLILLFVLIIISCNLFGSLSMLIIEKEDDAETLRSLGAKDILIRRIFLFEGWMISLTGLFIGLALGILICLVQMQFGIVKMPGNFVIDSYPVVISAWDILSTIGGVGLIGYLAAKLPLIIMKKNYKIS